ncbi:MAG: plasmid recombination protein [Oscillospiraceae bacterium]
MSEINKSQTRNEKSKSGAKKVSLSFRIDSGVLEHNNRDFIAKNVVRERIPLNITYKKESLEDKYHELFDKAIEEYNAKQKRSDRKINNYLEHIKQSKQEKPYYEIVVQIGDKDDCGIGKEYGDAAKEMLNEYMKDFEKRNPNMKVFNAVMHLDEATPHLHIDFVPICHSPNRGVPVRVSLKGALKEQGMAAESLRNSEWAVWAKSEKEKLSEILHKHDFGVQNKNTKHSHMEVDEYKEYAQTIQQMNEHINVLKQKPSSELTKDEMAQIKNQNDFLRSEIQKRDEKIQILSKRVGAKFVPFDVYSEEKIMFMCAELERIGVPNIAESNSIYVPEYALKTCASVATRYTPPKNVGVRAEIALDIDRLIYSSDNLNELLENLKSKLGYEIKTDGKYIAVKSPKAQRFVRLKSLGDEYLPNNIEKRISEKEKFPNVVNAKSKNAVEVEQKFFTTITQTIIEVRTLRYKPYKTNPKRIYSFDNDKDINFLSEQLLTMHEFNLNSREKIYEAAEECTKAIADKTENINRLNAEIPTLKSDIAQIKLLFSDLKNSKDTMAQMKISAAKEKAEKYGVKSEEDIDNLERRLKLIPMYVQNLKSETIDEQMKLARLKDLISTYEKIIEGNYIDNMIAAQKEREQQEKNQDKKV